MKNPTPFHVGPRIMENKALHPPAGYGDVRSGIVELLNAARQAAARNVNSLMTVTYWEIGRRIVEAEQNGKRRAGYGEQLIERLSLDLTASLNVEMEPLRAAKKPKIEYLMVGV